MEKSQQVSGKEATEAERNHPQLHLLFVSSVELMEPETSFKVFPAFLAVFTNTLDVQGLGVDMLDQRTCVVDVGRLLSHHTTF